jgi:beta-glucosidase
LIYSAQVLPVGFFALNGTLYTGGGSGAMKSVSSISPEDAFRQQAAIDGTILYTDFTSQNPVVKDPNNPCLVFINSQSSEGWDRSTLADVFSDTLIINVASQCNNIWDTGRQVWRLPSGGFGVMVRKSVLDVQVQGTLTL